MVPRRQPGVRGEGGHLEGETGEEEAGDEELAIRRERPARTVGEGPQVGGAGRGHEREDADEHQGGADGRVEHEPVARLGAGTSVVRVAVPADEHPHRHEDEFEGDEEQHGITGGERRERPGLDEQEAPEERRRAAPGRQVDPGVGRHEHPDGGGEEYERDGDAVDPERPAHPEVWQPRAVDA